LSLGNIDLMKLGALDEEAPHSERPLRSVANKTSLGGAR